MSSTGPFPVDLQRLRSSDDPFDYAEAFAVTFERPPYLARSRRHARRPHRRRRGRLVVPPGRSTTSCVNAGALVLAWGVRGILAPSNLYYVTAVDLALSLVIIFVLGALTIRALIFVHGRRRSWPFSDAARPRPEIGRVPDQAPTAAERARLHESKDGGEPRDG